MYTATENSQMCGAEHGERWGKRSANMLSLYIMQ